MCKNKILISKKNRICILEKNITTYTEKNKVLISMFELVRLDGVKN